MLAGFNEDIVVEGLTYHVQSEDRGVGNPILETLIYTGGQILEQVRTAYDDLVENGSVDEKALTARLEHQHKDVLRRVRHGEFVPEGLRALAELLPDDRSLTEDLERFLTQDGEVELFRLVWKPTRNSARVDGLLHVRNEKDGGPIGGALVELSAVCADGSHERAESESGVDGTAKFSLELPFVGLTALIFRAERGPGGGRLRVPLAAPKASIGGRSVTGTGA